MRRIASRIVAMIGLLSLVSGVRAGGGEGEYIPSKPLETPVSQNEPEYIPPQPISEKTAALPMVPAKEPVKEKRKEALRPPAKPNRTEQKLQKKERVFSSELKDAQKEVDKLSKKVGELERRDKAANQAELALLRQQLATARQRQNIAHASYQRVLSELAGVRWAVRKNREAIRRQAQTNTRQDKSIVWIKGELNDHEDRLETLEERLTSVGNSSELSKEDEEKPTSLGPAESGKSYMAGVWRRLHAAWYLAILAGLAISASGVLIGRIAVALAGLLPILIAFFVVYLVPFGTWSAWWALIVGGVTAFLLEVVIVRGTIGEKIVTWICALSFGYAAFYVVYTWLAGLWG